MARIVIMGALAILLLAAVPVAAQTDPADAWATRRAAYARQADQTAATLKTRGTSYLRETDSIPQGWWADWRRDQPYDKGVAYAVTPGTMDIPAQPDSASDSPYGKNVAALTYGTQQNAASGQAQANQAQTDQAQPDAAANAATDMQDLAGQ